jgi:hypothetical protein
LGKAGALLTFLAAGFYCFGGQQGELTTKTSPLTGAKWTLVLVLGWIGEAIALVVVVAAAYRALAAILNRTGRARRTT